MPIAQGLPKLINELQHKNAHVRLCALGSLNDELRDAEKCYIAFGRLHIVKRLAKVLHQEVSNTKNKRQTDRVAMERVVLNVATICSWLDGAVCVANESEMLEQIYSLIQEHECISWQAALVLANLASHPMVADQLIDQGHLGYVMKVLLRIVDVSDVYVALAYLIERNPPEALRSGYFELLFPMIGQPIQCKAKIMKCFACLLQCDEAHRKCDEVDAIAALCSVLGEVADQISRDPEACTEIAEYASMALHNCLLSTNYRLQLHSLQALRQLTEMPSIKNFVRLVCKRNIKRIYCNGSDEVLHAKQTLLQWLRFAVYRQEPLARSNPNEPTNWPDDFPYRIDRRFVGVAKDNDQPPAWACF